MGLDRIQDDFFLPMFPAELIAEFHMAALLLVDVQCLADVMQQSGPFGQLLVQTQFRGHDTSQVRHFHGMLQCILSIGIPVLHGAHQPDDLPVDPADAELEDGIFPGFHDLLVDFVLVLLHDFLDPARLDPAIPDQVFQGKPCHFPADGIETGNGDQVRGVVNVEFHTGGLFEAADVPPFTADDPAFHLFTGDGHDRDTSFLRLLLGDPLNGQGDDFLGFRVG